MSGLSNCSFFVGRACRSLSLQNGATPFGDIHETSRSVSHNQPRVNDQRFAQHTANLPQYEYENHAATHSSCVEGKPAVMPCSLDWRSCLSRFCPTSSLRLRPCLPPPATTCLPVLLPRCALLFFDRLPHTKLHSCVRFSQGAASPSSD